MSVSSFLVVAFHVVFLAAEPLLTTVPGTVEQSLVNSLRKLKEKRESNCRPENVAVRFILILLDIFFFI